MKISNKGFKLKLAAITNALIIISMISFILVWYLSQIKKTVKLDSEVLSTIAMILCCLFCLIIIIQNKMKNGK